MIEYRKVSKSNAKKVKFIFQELAVIAKGGIAGFFTPTFLLISFNFMHGPVNYPDGEMFVPLGIITLIAIAAVDVLIIVKTAKSKNMTRAKKIVLIATLVCAKAIGSLMIDMNDWHSFIYSFSVKFFKR